MYKTIFLYLMISSHFCSAASYSPQEKSGIIIKKAHYIADNLVMILTGVDGPLDWLEQGTNDPIRAFLIIQLMLCFDRFIHKSKPFFIEKPAILQAARKAKLILNELKDLWKKNNYLFLQHPLLMQPGYLHKNKSIHRLKKHLLNEPLFQNSLKALKNGTSNAPIETIHIFSKILTNLMKDASPLLREYTLNNLKEMVIQRLVDGCYKLNMPDDTFYSEYDY